MTFPVNITYASAIHRIQEMVLSQRHLATEHIKIQQAGNRILAEDVYSEINVPGFDRSALDGFAFNHAAAVKNAGNMAVYSRVFAGDDVSILASGHAVEITTGAPIPKGADTVVAVERVEASTVDDQMQISMSHIPKRNNAVRLANEDVSQGDKILPKSRLLKPHDIGLMAACGMSTVCVFSQIKVAIILTGSELCMPGKQLPPGHIYESAGVMLSSVLQQQGCAVDVKPVLRDEPTLIAEMIESCTTSDYDLVLTCGGVSAGEKDFIKSFFYSHNSVVFHKVQIKPGFPFLLANHNNCVVAGLPGNPVSAYVVLLMCMLPAVRLLQGGEQTHLPSYSAVLGADFNKSHGREEFARGKLVLQNENARTNQFTVTPISNQSSGRVSSLSASNAIIHFALEPRKYASGDVVKVYRMTDLLYPDWL